MFKRIQGDDTITVRMTSTDYQAYLDAKGLVSKVRGEMVDAELDFSGRTGGDCEVVKGTDFVDFVFQRAVHYSDF